ncbi:MAG: DUF488 family protein [Desulfobacteraceae bacterium]|nr:DUF488 family protein [Desulfobacteraceae bacterium]MBC2718196.1 DUF488 family protein [Desulfobacteraceae bacterium]
MKSLNHKQRILLKVIEALDEKGTSSRFMLVKNLFLLAHEENIGRLIKFYNFFPYKYGPFSNVCYADLAKLEKEGLLTEQGTHLSLTEKGVQAARTADRRASLKVKRVTRKFNSDREIRKYVYKKFPEYTVKSEIVPQPTKQTTPGLFTIGYEGRDIDSFLNTLIKNEIDLIIDVRKNPFSMNFSFTKNKLQNYLEKIGMQYIHIPELGIESNQRDNLSTLKDYQALFKKYQTTTLKEHPKQVEHITQLSRTHRAALMCFEADTAYCHRTIIARDIEMKHGMEATAL